MKPSSPEQVIADLLDDINETQPKAVLYVDNKVYAYGLAYIDQVKFRGLFQPIGINILKEPIPTAILDFENVKYSISNVAQCPHSHGHWNFTITA